MYNVMFLLVPTVCGRKNVDPRLGLEWTLHLRTWGLFMHYTFENVQCGSSHNISEIFENLRYFQLFGVLEIFEKKNLGSRIWPPETRFKWHGSFKTFDQPDVVLTNTTANQQIKWPRPNGKRLRSLAAKPAYDLSGRSRGAFISVSCFKNYL